MVVVDKIPDEDFSYMRVHKENIYNVPGENTHLIRPVAFDAKGEGGLSVDWSEHSTPQQTKDRATRFPENNGVISMPNIGIRKVPLTITHVPLDNNYAHTEIFGIPPRKPSDMGIRVRLMDISNWEIPCTEFICK